MATDADLVDIDLKADREQLTPRLEVSMGGKVYRGEDGPKSWTLTSSLTNLYDPFALEFDNANGRHKELLDLSLHRWQPITIKHCDPQVEGGLPIPALMGVITRIEHDAGIGPSAIRVTGYDLGKLLDSCGPAWKRIKGHTWKQLFDLLVDPSWRAGEGPSATGDNLWGIQGVTDLHRNRVLKLGQRVSSREIVAQAYGQKAYSFMPPVQIEPGEVVYDTLSRYARTATRGASSTKVVPSGKFSINAAGKRVPLLKTVEVPGKLSPGLLMNVSADGWVQLFNPDDYANEPAQYTFNYTLDERNGRIKDSKLILDGEGLYSDFMCYGSVIRLVYKKDSRDPNMGKFYAPVSMPGYLGVNRRLTFMDGEQYDRERAERRVDWKRKQALYQEWALSYTIVGHSWPGPGGKWIPLVEGLICEVFDTRNRVSGQYLIDTVTRQQSESAGTTTQILIRQKGLLGA